MDKDATYCPYCHEKKDQGHYVWREISIPCLSDFAVFVKNIRAIEIYCADCRHTLSITPIPE